MELDRRLWTYGQLAAELEETNRFHELWDGELIMSPSPSFLHQKIVERLHDAMKSWVYPRKLGETATAPLDMVLSPRQTAQPDILFVAQDRRGIIGDHVDGPADLVAEVISPGSRRRDRIDKRDLYEQHGVREYWMIDPEAGTVEVLALEAQQFVLVGRWRSGEVAVSRLLAGFTVPVNRVLAGID